MKLETPKQYNQAYLKSLIQSQGFDVTIVSPEEAKLQTPDQGAGIQCIDGRYGEDLIGVYSADSSIKDRVIIQRPPTKEGPKYPGGATGLAAVYHGADTVGLNEIAVKLAELGYVTGTHGKCGFAQLLADDRLSYLPFVSSLLPDFEFYKQHGITKGKLMRGLTRRHGGFHPTLEGLIHRETAVQFNPFDGTTTPSDIGYFKTDLWLAANHFGVSVSRSTILTLEVVRALAPHVNRVELIANV